AGIAGAVSISKIWLQEHIKKKRDEVRKQAFRMPEYEKFSWKPAGCGLLPEAERMTYGHDLLLKEAAGLVADAHAGKRDDAGAAALWSLLSEDCGKTSHTERLNSTFRQRVSALAMKTLSFSRCLENLTASAWRFTNNCNDCILFH
ncbi:hypothetical protein VU06_00310, partial [Desulfobulbus sp. F3]|nr:hypothetical protein [Desulfobulbus sp. F3]